LCEGDHLGLRIARLEGLGEVDHFISRVLVVALVTGSEKGHKSGLGGSTALGGAASGCACCDPLGSLKMGRSE
jgi:hypothetical protein